MQQPVHCSVGLFFTGVIPFQELRVEDYMANRKGVQAGSAGLFGSSSGGAATSQASSFSFGVNQQNKTGFSGFGGTSTGGAGLFSQQLGQQQQTSTGLFGGGTKPSLFGSTTSTSSSTGFGGFPQTSTTGGASLFGSGGQQKVSPYRTPPSAMYSYTTIHNKVFTYISPLFNGDWFYHDLIFTITVISESIPLTQISSN